MWREGWFRDYDAVAGVWSSERDAMHLAPIFCGAAGWGHVEQVRPALAEPPHHSSQWAPLSWPPVVMTLIGATAAAQMPQEAAELAYRFIDASFRSTDSRELDEYGGLPGVTREYRRAITKWGEMDYVNASIEGYGWGALSVHLLFRHLLGLRADSAQQFTVAHCLPAKLRVPNATYIVERVNWSSYLLDLSCQVTSFTAYRLQLTCQLQAQQADPSADRPAEQIYQYTCEGAWGQAHTFSLPQLNSANPPL